ncbi:MAG: ABC transporter permease [Clostridia bacterium]|nr:ABC transporter permease [Clostridia bacterium]
MVYVEGTSNLTFFEQYKSYSDDINNIYNGLKNDGYYVLNEREITSVITILFKINISTYKSMDIGLFNEMIDNEKFVKSQYDLLYGEWNKSTTYEISGRTYADTLLVLNQNNELDDYLLYALGFIEDSEMDNLFSAMLEDKDYTIKIDYNNIVGKEFKVYLKSDTYYNNGTNYVQTENKKPADENKDNYITLRISGIVKVNDETNGGALDEGLVYPKAFTDYCIDKFNTSAPVVANNLVPIDKSSPKSIAIYANSFEMKEIIEDFISEYNAGVGEDQKITYTDYMSLMMSTVSSIVDTVSYVLIAFVSVSLIVSSIMIGIITYISVLERTKEIGVLRSVGASKKDIKRVFTAESLIIGFASGMLGIIITLLLCIPINIIFKAFTGIGTLAMLPVGGGVILVLISMLLTFIAGLIPAQVASKKDPVIALRSE